tara:strand:+ start:1001 stop:1678 length:678 start_codon:yes stop_codon:yes gene_type:complete
LKKKEKFPKIQSLKQKKSLIKKSCLRWQKTNPEPKCELYYRTPYQLLISVVMSAQATDKSVNKCMKPLYEQDLTPDQVLKMEEAGIFEKIKSIGLAKTKSKNIYALTKILIKEHNYRIPSDRQELQKLPGVGRKTANVVLAEIYNQPTLAVDTHVYRVSRRLGLHREDKPEKVEDILTQIIDEKFLPAAHHWFILHGRYTCKAIKPNCQECIIKDLCPSLELFMT